MTSLHDFYPQRLTPWITRWMQRCAPMLARWIYWVDVVIPEAHLQRLKQLDGDRVLLLPNHPTFHDPIVIFLLSAKLGRAFYYMAAYETFQNPSTMFLIAAGVKPLHQLATSTRVIGGLRWLLQHLGMYSIRRGLADRASIAQTLTLLAEPDCHLVIFPEGGCSFQNDTVMPFRAGAVQMAFQTLNKYAKKGEEIPNLYIIPVSIKYHYTGDMQPVIERSLHRLEVKLGLKPTSLLSPYDRLRAIAKAVLNTIERDYGLTTTDPPSHDLNARIQALKLHVIGSCEQQLALAPAAGDLIRERVYRIQHVLNTQADDLDQKLVWSFALVEKAMTRLLNFDAIYDSYVGENPTPERFLDTLIRLEREVFEIDQPPPKGHRIASLYLGESLNLKDVFADYQQNRGEVVDRVVADLRQTVQDNLDKLNL